MGVARLPLGSLGRPARGLAQNFHHTGHRARVVAGGDHQLDAFFVALQLVFAAVLHHFGLAHDRDDLARAHVAARHGGGPDQALKQFSFGHAFHAVAVDDVPDLVAHHPGQLPLGLQTVEERLGDKRRPAGQGEGVDGRVVVQQREAELPGDLAGRVDVVDDVQQPPADLVDQRPLAGVA